MPGALDARDRSAALQKLAEGPLDVLVVGGGITGAGAALDAASRGLRVGLVESRDLAAGTSSRSSKLIHGGLRYLEHGDFKLVREALRERDLLVSRLAPHLVRPVPFLYPLYRKVVERPYVSAGLVIYDAMEGARRPVPHHRHLSARGALRRAPALRPDRLAGAMVYYDPQVDDARHTVTVARTAAAHGAIVLTRASARSLLRSPDGSAVIGARVLDKETDRSVNILAERVVVCAGVWTDLVRSLDGVQGGYEVRMSKGVHLVMPTSASDADTGIIVRGENSVPLFVQWASGGSSAPQTPSGPASRTSPPPPARTSTTSLAAPTGSSAAHQTDVIGVSPPDRSSRRPPRPRPRNCRGSMWWTCRCPGSRRSPAGSSPPTG
jgi:glycerol-3-phosphate dehydrogenase